MTQTDNLLIICKTKAYGTNVSEVDLSMLSSRTCLNINEIIQNQIKSTFQTRIENVSRSIDQKDKTLTSRCETVCKSLSNHP